MKPASERTSAPAHPPKAPTNPPRMNVGIPLFGSYCTCLPAVSFFVTQLIRLAKRPATKPTPILFKRLEDTPTTDSELSAKEKLKMAQDKTNAKRQTRFIRISLNYFYLLFHHLVSDTDCLSMNSPIILV